MNEGTKPMRIYFKGDLTAEYKDRPVIAEPETPEALTNLVSSLVDTDENRIYYNSLFQGIRGAVLHRPVFDLDFPCRLVESSTPGHFHLYMETEVTWLEYQNVLTAMVVAGILEPGWVAAAIANRAAMIRKPEVRKKLNDSSTY